MADLLRATENFPAFRDAISLHLVETSHELRKKQAEAVGATEVPSKRPLLQKPLGGVPVPPLVSGLPETADGMTDEQLRTHLAAAHDAEVAANPEMVLPDGKTVKFHSTLATVPSGPILFIGQEILDALPVHQFEYTSEGWRERLVDLDDGTGEQHFRFILSREETPAVKSFLRRRGAAAAGEAQEGVGGEGGAQKDKYNSGGALPGDQIEVCPMATALVQDVGNRIARSRGGALFIDYGGPYAFENSLRGFFRCGCRDGARAAPLRLPRAGQLSANPSSPHVGTRRSTYCPRWGRLTSPRTSILAHCCVFWSASTPTGCARMGLSPRLSFWRAWESVRGSAR